MKIAIIDADLIGRKRHRFPNLACMKLSGFYKAAGNDVTLKTDYECLDEYDKVFISKVFTDTEMPDGVLELENVEYGGTGFFFDEAPPLPHEIDHHFPDYYLYDDFVNAQIESAVSNCETEEEEIAARRKARNEFKGFTDYSIGFLTRGCFRKCPFCVNQKYDRVFAHSPLKEFLDPNRLKICLLDDNFFGFESGWKELLTELHSTGKPFTFKQGLDERLLTDEKCELLCASKYDGDITFAFDNIKDYPLIEKKLQLIRLHTEKQFTFYVLVGFESQDEKDIEGAFKRIKLLMKYRCVPYIMRFEKYKQSKYRGMYINLARWCNQPSFFKKKSFREFCLENGESSAAVRYMREFESEHPDIAGQFFDMRFEKEAG